MEQVALTDRLGNLLVDQDVERLDEVLGELDRQLGDLFDQLPNVFSVDGVALL